MSRQQVRATTMLWAMVCAGVLVVLAVLPGAIAATVTCTGNVGLWSNPGKSEQSDFHLLIVLQVTESLMSFVECVDVQACGAQAIRQMQVTTQF